MGNDCKKICDQGQGSSISMIPVSPIYSSALKSKIIDNFPHDNLPQTVKQKLNKFDLNYQINDSRLLWTYQNSQEFVGYMITDKLGNEDMKQQNQQNLIFKPQKYQKVLLFLFKKIEQQQKKQQPDAQSDRLKQLQDKDEKLILDRVYSGHINQQMRDDDAIIILESGQYYKGSIDEFKFNGRGQMNNAISTHSYKGEWRNDIPHGQGVEQLKEKFVYQGQFKNGKWNGQGKLILFLQSGKQYCYTGKFIDGFLQGPGVTELNGRVLYNGEFVNGKQHGNGTWTGQNGQSYVGEFVEGRKQGKGEYYFKPDLIYKGSFKNGKPNGQGELFKDGIVTKGQWYNGKNILVYNKKSQ